MAQQRAEQFATREPQDRSQRRDYFNDLPTELLLQILHHPLLSQADLYRLSFLCERFHYIVLPYFLQKREIRDPQHSTDIYLLNWGDPRSFVSPDTLSGLNFAATTYLHGKTINELACYFQYPASSHNVQQNPERFPYAVDRLRRFIEKLGGVRTVDLYLISSRDHIAQNVTVTPRWLVHWKHAFSQLLDVIVLRGVVSLSVSFDSHLGVDDQAQFCWKTPLNKPYAGLKQTIRGSRDIDKVLSLSGHWWEFVPPKGGSRDDLVVPLTQGVLEASSVSPLTSFAVHSTILLLPPFLSWTLRLVDECPSITDFSIGNISLSAAAWQVILPALADALSTKLKKLAITKGCVHLHAELIIPFLCRFENLTHLTIERVGSYIPKQPMRSHHRPTLSHFQALSVPVEYAALFLGKMNDVPKRFGTSPTPSLPTSTLDTLTLSCDQLTVLETCTSPSPAITCNAITSQINSNRIHPVRISLDVRHDLNINYHSILLSLEHPEPQIHGNTDPSALSGFKDVWGIIFAQYHYEMCRSGLDPTTFCRWLHASFPALREVTFAPKPNAQCVKVSPTSVEPLLTAMTVVLPHVMKVTIEKQVFVCEGYKCNGSQKWVER